jgi:N-acetylmuramoyl-L-alanine amidase
MLDPGHGGKDPGAIGVTGTYEKHIAFAAAEELQRNLNRAGRCRVELTRGRDVFIPLQDRVAIAQRRDARLFLSLHADALSDPGVRGASIYTLSDTASDAQTAALARRENSADRFGGPSFRNMPPAIASILGSLVRRETREGSVRIARHLVNAMRPAGRQSGIKLLTHPTRHAGFMVLRAADIPSALVEMGFMSNPQDEAALRHPEYRTRVATVLAQAVEGFLAGSEQEARLAG